MQARFVVHPRLFNALMKDGQGNLLRYYLLVRNTIDPVLDVVTRKQFIVALSRYTTRRNAYKIIHQGDGFLWEYNRDRKKVHLVGLKCVGEKYAITRDRCYWAETDYLLDKVKFRSLIVASLFVDGKTISRAKLKQITGRSKNTQIKYERQARVKKTWNYGQYTVRTENAPIFNPRVKAIEPVGSGHSEVRVVFQMPNSYSFDLCKAGKRRYRVHTIAKRVDGHCIRLFYDDPRSAYKRIGKQDVFVRRERVAGRSFIWDYIPGGSNCHLN